MTLDDRSLRGHLDRRAGAGVGVPVALADAVVAKLAADARVWWRRPVSSKPMLGIAAAAAAAALVAVALGVLPPSDNATPGASSTEAAVTPPATEGPPIAYPAILALTPVELGVLLGTNPADRASIVMIAAVELAPRNLACDSSYCPDLELRLSDRTITVYNWDGPTLPSPYAFRVLPEGSLELLGSVRPAPEGLAWTLPQLTAELPSLRGAGADAVPLLYLVDAVRAVSTAEYRCRAVQSSDVGPDFGCGSGVAWLVPDEASVTTDVVAPRDGLRVPNVTGFRTRSDALRQRGFWLVNPWVRADNCFLCPPAGAADLLSRVLTFEELGSTAATPEPSDTASPILMTPAPPGIGVLDIALSKDTMTLDGFEVGDVTITARFIGNVIPMGPSDGLTPVACLRREGDEPADSHLSLLYRSLDQVPGTNEWSGVFRLTSGQAGTWRVGCLVAFDSRGARLDIDPAQLGISPALIVTGTHRPELTMVFDPKPGLIGQPLTVSGNVTDENDVPFVGVYVTIGRGDVCANGGRGDTVTTDDQGHYSFVIEAAEHAAVCAWLAEKPGTYPMPPTSGVMGIYATRLAVPILR